MEQCTPTPDKTSSAYKLKHISTMSKEAQELFDAEVLAAYRRGRAEQLSTHNLLLAMGNTVSFILTGFMAVAVIFIIAQLIMSRFPPKPIVPEDPTREWAIFKSGPLGTLYVYSPEPGVRCYKLYESMHETHYLGCVPLKETHTHERD